jgi:hypothetical protein
VVGLKNAPAVADLEAEIRRDSLAVVEATLAAHSRCPGDARTKDFRIAPAIRLRPKGPASCVGHEVFLGLGHIMFAASGRKPKAATYRESLADLLK